MSHNFANWVSRGGDGSGVGYFKVDAGQVMLQVGVCVRGQCFKEFSSILRQLPHFHALSRFLPKQLACVCMCLTKCNTESRGKETGGGRGGV